MKYRIKKDHTKTRICERRRLRSSMRPKALRSPYERRLLLPPKNLWLESLSCPDKTDLPANISALPVPLKTSGDGFRERLRRSCGSLALRLALRLDRASRRIPFYLGALCSVALLCAICAATVSLSLFGRFFAPYRSVSVPSLEGKTVELARSSLSDGFELIEEYEQSDTVSRGEIISQYPSAGAQRRIYGSKLPSIRITVSLGRGYLTLEDMSGMSARDALLELRNAGVAVKTVLAHSDTVEYGAVISSSPSAGERIYDGELITLTLSLGKRIANATVPDLCGLNEAEARSLLSLAGLRLGKITYVNSSKRAGRVVSQQYAPLTSLALDSAVDLCVSIGESYAQKTVPDLTGLDVESAEETLLSAGLSLGAIYAVSSAAPIGTVVAQTPVFGAPISPSTLTVDIFISS